MNEFGAGCSGFVCDNAKLREMIADAVKDPAVKRAYLDKIEQVRTASAEKPEEVSGRKLKEQEVTPPDQKEGDNRAAMRVILGIIVVALLAVILGHRRGKNAV